MTGEIRWSLHFRASKLLSKVSKIMTELLKLFKNTIIIFFYAWGLVITPIAIYSYNRLSYPFSVGVRMI